MPMILPGRACYIATPKTGSSWVRRCLTLHTEGPWVERRDQHATPAELGGAVNAPERRAMAATAREPVPWLRSVWRWGTAGGNWEALPGVASLLWPVERRTWEQFLIWHARENYLDRVVEAYTRDVGTVLRTSHLEGDLVAWLRGLGISVLVERVRVEAPLNTSTGRTMTRSRLEVPAKLRAEIEERNPLTVRLARSGRGYGR